VPGCAALETSKYGMAAGIIAPAYGKLTEVLIGPIIVGILLARRLKFILRLVDLLQIAQSGSQRVMKAGSIRAFGQRGTILLKGNPQSGLLLGVDLAHQGVQLVGVQDRYP